jgi:hypothetical protein
MSVTKTNLALVVGLLAALITPQAMDMSFEPLAVTASSEGMLTLTANHDVSWLVLEDAEFQVVDRQIVLSRPVRVVAISSGEHVIWDPRNPAPVVPPVVPDVIPVPMPPVGQLTVLIGSWVPASNNSAAVAENFAMIAKKIEAGELSSPDMIMASLIYANRKDQVGKEWAEFIAKIADLMRQRQDWDKIFTTASEVCYEAAKLS